MRGLFVLELAGLAGVPLWVLLQISLGDCGFSWGFGMFSEWFGLVLASLVLGWPE